MKFICGIITGGLATVLLAVGIWGICKAFALAFGWAAILLFLLALVSLAFGVAMTRVIGECVMLWSSLRNLKDKDEKENEDAKM